MKQSQTMCFLVVASLWLSACGGGGSSDNAGELNISGQVSGLDTGSVSLRNRDSSIIVVANDGRFSFSSSASSGYDIKVVKNPLEQLCQVTNGSASSINGDVNNIQVACESVATAPACRGDADSDGDQLSDCQELNVYETNPWLADTDGDGYLDGEEAAVFDSSNTAFRFNPRISDMAVIAIDLTSLPQIELNFSESDGSTRTIGTAYDQSETSGISKDWGGESSRQLELGHTISVSRTDTVGVEVEASIDGGVTGSYETSLTLGYEQSSTQTIGSSVNWSAQQSQQNSQTYSESLDISETSGTTYNDGTLLITAKVRNAGHIAYDLENLTLSAVLFDPKRPFDILPIGNLTYSAGGFPTTTITTGSESAPLNFSTTLSLQKAQELLRDSKNVVITASTYRLLDADSRSILLVDEDVAVRTAFITVDYGIHVARQDKYRVAVNKGDGSRGISATDALTGVLGLSVTQGIGEWVYGNDAASTNTKTGVLSVNEYGMDGNTNRYWLVAHNRNKENGAGTRTTDFYHVLLEDYNLDDIVLRAGDHLTLVYVGDADRDGLSDRLEVEYGTDPDKRDTDSDTLSDVVEIYGWLTNLSLNEAPCDTGDLTRVYSNPLLPDSDGDSLRDDEEKAQCNNPSFDFIAQAGDDQIVNKASQVTLRGSISGIANGGVLYNWRLLSGPDISFDGNRVRELNGREPTFMAPNEVSTLRFALDVTIGEETQSDEVIVQVMHDRMKAVFVGRNDVSGVPDGTMDNPYANIAEALTFIDPGEDLYVMTQTTPYLLTNSLVIPDGSSLFGGYDENWVRDAELNRTSIVLNTTVDRLPAIDIPAASSEMWISGFAVSARDNSVNAGDKTLDLIAMRISSGVPQVGPVYLSDNNLESGHVKQDRVKSPGSSYALFVKNMTDLYLHDNVLSAGRGGNGVSGRAREKGSDGDPGGKGRTGGAGSAGGNGGKGGDWGRGPLGKGGNGVKGGPSKTGGAGGTGAKGCKNATSTGKVGDVGSAGILGRAAGLFDHSRIDGYKSKDGGNGGNGGHGKGGGGGAGGGGCGTAGGGVGGGGGEGGTGGAGGIGGVGGGASIALWLSGEISSMDIRGNDITSFNGGVAGNGGKGGEGGDGGRGAGGGKGGENCLLVVCDRGGSGSRGGNGGDGGAGAYGAGGSGGPSFGIYVSKNIAPVLNDNNITSGGGGNGGNNGNSGNGGHSYAIYDADLQDGLTPLVNASNVLSAGIAGISGAKRGRGSKKGANGMSGDRNF